MTESNNVRLSGKSLWKATLTAEKDLDLVLGSVRNLPLVYWRNRFFFGADDHKLAELTDGKFPKKLRPGKSHPVFTLTALPSHAGYRVCPCTSKKPLVNKNKR